MNPIVGWGLAGLAVVAGWIGWGVPGVALAITVITFWLLLQFSRALRVMRMAAGRPVGHVDSAVMLNARLGPGLSMMQVIPLTRSLGRRVGDDDTWRWTDAAGDHVTLSFQRGRLARWVLERAAPNGTGGPPADEPPPSPPPPSPAAAAAGAGAPAPAGGPPGT
jgi:hypothetical protein